VRVKNELSAMRELEVGKVAPDIVGQDTSGKPLRLHDHRGKVTVILFWGSWCPGTRRSLPQLNALVKRMEGKPFVMIGVNSDKDREKVKELEKDQVNWRSFFDGKGLNGEICNHWNKHCGSTAVILDHHGVIRHHGWPDDAVVDALVAAVRKAK